MIKVVEDLRQSNEANENARFLYNHKTLYFMKKISLLVLLAVTNFTLFAATNYDAIIDNLKYTFYGSTATVVGCTDINTFPNAYQLTEDDFTYLAVDIVIPSTVTYNANNYTVTTIDSYAFNSTKNGYINSVVIPNTVSYIGESAFAWQYYLKFINIPEGITSIEKNAFCGLGISNIILPSTLTYIGEMAFSRCRNLQSIIIPDNVSTIDQFAFDGCENLSIVQLPNNLHYIKQYAFNFTGLQQVYIPENVWILEDRAFAQAQLKKVTIASSTCSIGVNAFSWNPLEEATIASTGQYMFELDLNNSIPNRTNKLSITLLDGLTYIAPFAFYNTDIENITIPASVTSLGQGAFSECKDLQTITFIGNNISEFPNLLFNNCKALAEISIPEGVSEIGECVFKECSALRKIVFPSTLSKMGGWNFDNNSYDTTLNVYISSLSQWLNIDFARNEYEYLEYSNPLTYTPNLYVNNAKLQDILTIPSNVYELHFDILGMAIQNVKGVEIPSSVGQVYTIGWFGDYIKWMKMEHETPPAIIISDYLSVQTLLVPCGCIRAYRDADGWKEITQIWDIPYYYELSVNQDFIEDNYYDLGDVEILQKPTCDNEYTIIVKANPREGYHFNKWSDGNEENPRTIQLNNHTYLTAEFAEGEEGFANIQKGKDLPSKLLRDGNVFILRGEKIYTLQGQEVR